MTRINQHFSTPKIFYHAKSTSKKIGISKRIKVFFAIVLVTFSLDFGFFKFNSFKTNILVKSICVLQISIISFTIVYFYSLRLEDPVFSFWYFMYIFEYCILVIGLIFTKSTFFNFCNDLIYIDAELGIEESSKLEFIIITWTGSCVIFRSMLSLIYCTCLKDYCISVTFVLFIFFIPLLCADVFLIVGFTIYYSLYSRLKVFTMHVNNGYSDIVACQYLYKSIGDIADSIRSSYNPLYVVSLFFHTIDMMISVFYPLIGMDIMREDASVIIVTQVPVLQMFVMLFAPAFAAGLLSSQVEKLQVVLQNRLLQERDQKHSRDIERFLGYIEVRDLKTRIYKVIPLNWHLPVIVVNLSVTYLIVMLQFTHKY